MSFEMSFYFLIFFGQFLSFSCANQKVKLDYLEKLIESALQQSNTYKVRENNSDYFEKLSDNEPIDMNIEVFQEENDPTTFELPQDDSIIIDNINIENSNYTLYDFGTFDFIIVGAGSSGSVVASRLSEIEKWRILLLEAGDMDDDFTDIPYIWELLQFSDRNWGYNTVPQQNGCFGYSNNQSPYPRGKILGGSGSINGLGFMRGNQGDYNKWASLGNPGWSYKDLLHFFKKMENFESDKFDPNYRGFAGPLNIQYQLPKDNVSFFESSGQELGLTVIDDFNNAEQMGISRGQRTVQYGKRVSGATAYVKPSMSRHNFNLTLNALVTKILIEQSSRIAEGVTFVKNGKIYKATASKEVIISGGAINTPQLLMLSGIGPQDDLNKLKMNTIVNLPVGKKTLDHFKLKIIFRTNYTMQRQSIRELLREYLQGRGVLTSLDNGKAFAYINTRNSSATLPNLEIAFHFHTPVQEPIRGVWNYKKEVEDYYNMVNRPTDFYVDLYVLHPKSTGSVKLRTDNPRDFPLVDPGTFTNEDDAQVFLEGIRFLDRFEKTKTARKYNVTKLKIPFCGDHVEGSDGYWLCLIKNLGVQGGHISSSAKMGPKADPFAVVDHKLRVYGVGKLRVVDCSIMPTTTSGHTNSIAFAIGEKGADLIKKRYKV